MLSNNKSRSNISIVQTDITELFKQYPHLAILISIGISIVISVIGVIPSVFLTGANVLFFGFWQGTIISFFGEAIGAAIAFILYRKGFKNASRKGLQKYTKVQRLIETEGKEAFILILSLRLIPFIPSGIITFAAAIGKVSLYVFFMASSAGKIPALLMEAYSIYEVTRFGWQGKAILLIIAVGFIFFFLKKNKQVF